MWIFCSGAVRSGSTLQFNIVAELLEHTGNGKRIEFVEPKKFPELKKKYENDSSYKVFKIHELTQSVKEEFEHNRACAIYSYRDIRDVIISLAAKSNTSIEDTIKANAAETYIKNYIAWRTVPRVYRARYEAFAFNMQKEIENTGNYLNISIDKKIIQNIAKKLDINTLKEKQRHNLKSRAEGFDKNTLLHNNHINSGKAAQWKTKMTKNQIADVEKRAKHWLFNHNYELETKKLYKKVKLYCYSQHGEDDFIWRYFNKKRDGLIIDVGAFDGIHLSNSYALENIGWKSVNIEPNPEMYNILKTNRPSAENINAALIKDESADTVSFKQEALGLLSGLQYDEKDIQKRYNRRGLAYEKPKEIAVKTYTLNNILKNLNVEPSQTDCISIDVEGTELSVLKGLDINYYKPRMLITEANNQEAEGELTAYMQSQEYKKINKLGPNLIFVPKDSKSMKKYKFRGIPMPQIHPLGEKYTIGAKYPSTKNKRNRLFSRSKKLISKLKSFKR